MKALSEDQKVSRVKLVDQLREEASRVRAAIANLNESLEEHRTEIRSAVANYNAAVQEAEEFREEVATEAGDYFDEKPEKWQESERGQAYYGWVSEWQEGLGDIDVDFPDDVEEPDMDAADALEGLPDKL